MAIIMAPFLFLNILYAYKLYHPMNAPTSIKVLASRLLSTFLTTCLTSVSGAIGVSIPCLYRITSIKKQTKKVLDVFSSTLTYQKS